MRRFLVALAGLLVATSALAGLVVQRQAQYQGASLGLPDPTLDPRPDNLFAVNVALENATREETAHTLDTIQQAGFGWIKQNFRWAEIEPVRGRFVWDGADRIVDGAAARGLGVIAVLVTTPEWARTDHSIETAPPIDEADFANFARAFALRYGDRVDVYQIWDEPNLASAWGRPDSAADYLRVLQPAYAAIHAADPHATVLLAALAPTVETGPNNLSDYLYLRALYLAGAAPFFDAASAKPYGYNTSPLERGADPNVLNFSRLLLMRQEMAAHGDAHKLLWAGNFGWNALPAGWTGEPSLWGQVSESQQAEYTAQSYARAAEDWPWAGPLALENYRPDPDPPGLNPFGDAPERDARWGFALVEATGQPRPVLDAVRHAAALPPAMLPGNHPADDPAARYQGDWEFSELGADIPQFGPARITLDFVGTELAVRARRADYRAYLYVTVDGQPAPGLPRDSRGAYRVLTSPDLMPHIDTLLLARGLPYGRHTAVIEADRGWDQWAIVSFSVGRSPDDQGYLAGMVLAGALALACAVAAVRSARRLTADRRPPQFWGGQPSGVGGRSAVTGRWSVVIAALTAGLLWLSAALTWGGQLPELARRLAEGAGGGLAEGAGGHLGPPLLALLTAGLFYLSPWLALTALSLAALFVLLVVRLDVGLALIALFAPFYLQPRPLFDRAFSMVEITTLLAVAALAVRAITTKARGHEDTMPKNLRAFVSSCLGGKHFRSLDYAVLCFVLVSLASAYAADIRGVATRELRVILLEPALCYLLLRAAPLDRRAVWRIVDFWMIGAVVVAAIGLFQYVTGTNLIAAEGGVLRLRSVYGSPNNVGLYLGRALPVLTAVALLGGERVRRVAYGLGALIVLPAIVLSFSKGALLLGVPASLGVVAVGAVVSAGDRRRPTADGGRSLVGGRRSRPFWLLAGLAALVAAAALGSALLLRLPRFANVFDLTTGTSFFRLQVWGSALAMIRDHPWLGVGPDNFLYAYRGQYINPAAWQEPNLSHAHNVLLDFATRLGLPGLAAFLWMQVAFFRAGWRVVAGNVTHPAGGHAAGGHAGPPLRTALAVGLLASMIDFLAHGMVDASFFFVDLAFVYFLTLGLMMRLRE